MSRTRNVRSADLLTIAAVLLASISSARAQNVYFAQDDPRGTLTNSMQVETNFKAALGLSGTETVDGLTRNQQNPTLVFGATGVTATAGGTFVYRDSATATRPLAVSGNQGLFTLFGGTQTFTFNNLITGFGTYLVNVGETVTANSLTFKLENTLANTGKVLTPITIGPNASFTNVAYFGVVDTSSAFNRVTVTSSNLNDVFLYDSLTTSGAAAVPEPAWMQMSVLLVGMTGAGLLHLRRRKIAA